MLFCKNCGERIPERVKVGNKEYTLHHRSYCLNCNPLNERRFWGGKRVEPGKRRERKSFVCKSCGKNDVNRSRNNECSTCRSKKTRTARKAKAVEYLGGKCKICEYDKCLGALDFHHVDPKEKEFNLSNNWEKSWEFIEKELKKCVLLCCRCHAEVHAGIVKIPT